MGFLPYATLGTWQPTYPTAPTAPPTPGRGVQFGQGAILHHSANPTPLFGHEDEDDFDAAAEGGAPSPGRGSSQARISCALSHFFLMNTTYSVHIGDAALQAGVIIK
jgi:hypothetical protein